MQWGLIFGHESVLNDFSKLTGSDKTLIGAAYLYKQKRLIQRFDSLYRKNLVNAFEQGIIECIKERGEVDAARFKLERMIPDTEAFPEPEGAYAQHLMIALIYLLGFSKSGKPDVFEDAIAMALENIELISYEADEGYRYDSMLKKERLAATLMIGRLGEENRHPSDLASLSHICTGFSI